MESLLIGGLVLVLTLELIGFLGGGQDEDVKNRMSMFASMGAEEDEFETIDQGPAKEKKVNPVLQMVGAVLTPKALANWFERQLERADVLLRPNEFAGIVFLASMIPAGLIYLISRNLVLTLAGLLCGFGPVIWLFMAYRKRLRRFNDQMLDTLTLLANAVKAGYSIVQAMEMVAKESPDPMGTEFSRVIREVSLGVTIEEALENLKTRVPSDELDLMVTVIMIQRQIGGNLSEILESIANTIRERNKLNGMIAALTAQGRMSGIVIGGMPFALCGVLYVINPKYMSLLWTYSDGAFHSYYLIILCIVMEGVGFIIINKIISVEV